MARPRGGDQRQGLGNRQANVIRQRRRRGASAALAAIDMDIVRAALWMGQAIGEPLVEKRRIADHHLHPDRLAGEGPHPGDELAEFADAADIEVPVGADAVLADGDAAHRGDFGRHLGARQDAAFAGLGALRELDLEHPHLRMGRDGAQLGFRQIAVLVAHAVFGGAHLHDEVRPAGQMLRRQPTLPGGHPYPGQLGALGQRADRRVAQGAVAHAADVEEALGEIGRGAGAGSFGDADLLAGIGALFGVQDREGGVAKNEARHVLAAEADQVGDALGRAIHPGPVQPVERPFRPIRQIMILPHVFAPGFRDVAEMADHREVAQDGVVGLAFVADVDGGDRRGEQTYQR